MTGWVLNVQLQASAHMVREVGQQHQHLPNELLATDLNYCFKWRDIDYLWAIGTDYPRGSLQPVIVLVRRRREDPTSTMFRFYCVRELDADREMKKQILEENELNDEDLPWSLLRIRFSDADVVSRNVS